MVEIYPTRSVRLSMCAYIRPEKDKLFRRVQFAQYLQGSKIFLLGESLTV
jgi:hypothetical protein